MASELKSFIKNDTWEVMDRPRNAEVIGSRLVLRNKYRTDGSIEKRKARLVARGFSQRPGIHFDQTFAPVARLRSIRLLMALAVHHRMEVHQLDVATAYLNGILEEKVYMEPPEHILEALEVIIEDENCKDDTRIKAQVMLEKFEEGNKVCLLKKSLYGLKQAGRNWHATLDKALRKYGATPCDADPCIYKISEGDDLVLIAVYVDDIIMASKNKKKI